jgi:hypothetical protein
MGNECLNGEIVIHMQPQKPFDDNTRVVAFFYNYSIVTKSMEWTIQNIQIALKKEGFYKGEINGKFDDKTKFAILACKKAKKLKYNSQLDKDFIALLEKSKELGYYTDLAFYDEKDRDDIEGPPGFI